MSSLERKRNTVTSIEKPSLKKQKLLPPTSIPSLPDDLLISVFARVSRVYYPILSLVSKSFRSLLASSELYETRSLLGRTESCLYLCLKEGNPNSKPLWSTLCRKPNRTVTNGTLNLLVPIPVLNPPLAHRSGHASVGSNIYYFGGYMESVPSSRVLILDCRSHTLREAPSMQLERLDPSACVIGGKIYVAGGFDDEDEDSDSLYPVEVFDIKTQIWDHRFIPFCREIDWGSRADIDGKFYLKIGGKVMTYDPEQDRLDLVQGQMDWQWRWSCNCAIGNVLYCCSQFEFRWYDTKLRMWKYIKGLKGLPGFGYNVYFKLADYGGKMAVFWDYLVPSDSSGDKKKTIWCAVIALERPNPEEIWGKVEWYDAVLTVPVSYVLEHALAVTL